MRQAPDVVVAHPLEEAGVGGGRTIAELHLLGQRRLPLGEGSPDLLTVTVALRPHPSRDPLDAVARGQVDHREIGEARDDDRTDRVERPGEGRIVLGDIGDLLEHTEAPRRLPHPGEGPRKNRAKRHQAKS